ncbi:hypothetical protein [Candidatus Spongiihabitans sp.]|uniref:hypothetical protein n=1 Tax=Candidatus Spongiihabitans sp. TaxID=3101308 RepID=UPI003C7A384C
MPTAREGGSADNAGNNYLPTPQAQGLRQRRRIMSAACAAGVSLDYRVKPDNDGGGISRNRGGVDSDDRG